MKQRELSPMLMLKGPPSINWSFWVKLPSAQPQPQAELESKATSLALLPQANQGFSSIFHVPSPDGLDSFSCNLPLQVGSTLAKSAPNPRTSYPDSFHYVNSLYIYFLFYLSVIYFQGRISLSVQGVIYYLLRNVVLPTTLCERNYAPIVKYEKAS